MGYCWRADHTVVAADLRAELETDWATQAEAEAWLAQTYADLVDEGVGLVTLLVDGTELYEMSLDDQ